MRRQRLDAQNRLASRPARKESSRLSETAFLVRVEPSKKAADVNIRPPHPFPHLCICTPRCVRRGRAGKVVGYPEL